MTYVFQAFPKWKYHESGDALMVDDAEAEVALGDGWHDAPIPPKELSEREELIALASAKGIKIDKRWSDARVRAALVEAPVEAPVEPVVEGS